MGIYVRTVSKSSIWRVDILILVTLGTNDKSFIRLIKKIEELIDKKMITEKVVVQAGFTKYESEKLEIFDLIPMDKFNELMEECSLLITHGGVGTIISGLKNNKKVVAVPRLAKYGEHVNDHQLQIIDNFSEAGYILGMHELEELEDKILQVESFTPKHYESNRDNMIDLVRKYINM